MQAANLYTQIKVVVSTVLFIVFLPDMSTADKPVKIEDLIAEERDWEIDFILSYNSLHKKEDEFANQLIEQKGNIIAVYDHNEWTTNTDRLYYYLGLKYGLWKDLEISAFGSGYTEFSRDSAQDEYNYEQATEFNNAGVEIMYQIKEENEYPALITSINAHMVDNTEFPQGFEKSYFKTYSARAVTYYTIDPVVFSLDSQYTIFLEREKGEHSIDPGEKFSLSPVLYFIVNPYTTVYWGFEWYIQGSSKLDKEKVDPTRTGLPFIIGCGYEINGELILDINFEYEDTGGMSQSSASFELNYVF
ncbi:MAG TPA: hypothetical protein VKM37_03610 [Balneolaceae bacterium]|nr:hypothetical protein [Balneolaceae bacterium]